MGGGGGLIDKTRQDNALFGVLYSPMYIDFIQLSTSEKGRIGGGGAFQRGRAYLRGEAS